MMLSIQEYVEILIGQDIWRRIQEVDSPLVECGKFLDCESYCLRRF